jgi:hypothetical protein
LLAYQLEGSSTNTKQILGVANQTHVQSALFNFDSGSMLHKHACPLTRSETDYAAEAMTQVRTCLHETVKVFVGEGRSGQFDESVAAARPDLARVTIPLVFPSSL